MVLLHAGVADRTMSAEHLQPLALNGHRVVAMDLPGFGQAPATPSEQAPSADVLQTMDELGIERAALIGNSSARSRSAWRSWRPSAYGPGAHLGARTGTEPSPQLEAAWETEEKALDREDLDAAIAAVLDTWTLPGAPDTCGTGWPRCNAAPSSCKPPPPARPRHPIRSKAIRMP